MSMKSISNSAITGLITGTLVGVLGSCWITWMRPLFPIPPPLHGLTDRLAFSACPFLLFGWMPWHHSIPTFYTTVVLLNALLYCAVFVIVTALAIRINKLMHKPRVA